MKHAWSALCALAMLVSMANAQDAWRPLKEHATAVDLITEESLRAHIRFLADDLLEGRGPGSRGDELTQLYLSTQFESLGYQPMLPDGQWLQPVPLVGVTSTAPASVDFRAGDKSVTLKHHDDTMLVAGRPAEKISLQDAELVFVGYGIQAPEYAWDDYKGADLKGKVLVMMNNDPRAIRSCSRVAVGCITDVGITSTNRPRDKVRPARSSFIQLPQPAILTR